MKASGGDYADNAEMTVGQLPFTVAAAHELKAPLALIRQLSLSLEQAVADEEQRQILKRIILTSEKGIRLTSDLTRAARVEDSLFELEPINPRQLCEEVAHELTPLYKARDREIRVAPGRRQLLVVANRELLRRILINFGDNALQYASDLEPVIIQTSSIGKEKVRVGIRDYGPAVPSSIWRQIRRHLGVSPQVMHSRPASSGLGLYISGQFAEVMQGSIGATRHQDGATFFVDLLSSQQLRLL